MTVSSFRQPRGCSGKRRDAAHARVAGVVRRWLGALSVDRPISFGGVTVIPLRAPAAADPGWLLLPEALAQGFVEISEVSEAGSVPTARVVNAGPQYVLLLDGEELIGAKQNRVLNTTVLVGPCSRTTIPVSCVDQGRWAYQGRRFSSSGNSLYAGVRRTKLAEVSLSLSQGYGHTSSQARIWRALSARANQIGVASPAMADAFAANARRLRAYQDALPAGGAQIGAIVYGGDAWWGMETLASAELFAKAWPRILSGYAMDVLCGAHDGEPGEDGTERLDAVLRAAAQVFPGISCGADCRLRGEGVAGAALVARGIVGHFVAFPC
jgi:hypothetical protein